MVMARDIQAVKFIQVWGARIGGGCLLGWRPLTLLVAITTTTPHTPLLLATAVNRFLNHVSHLAMNMWGLSKFARCQCQAVVRAGVVGRAEARDNTRPDARTDCAQGCCTGLTSQMTWWKDWRLVILRFLACLACLACLG